METDFRNAKVGDRVWSFIHGWGFVDEIYEHKSFPIKVIFNWGKSASFNMDGNQYIGIGLKRVLFWDEIKFDIPTRPKRLVKKTVEAWANVYKAAKHFHPTQEKADYYRGSRIACVKLTGEYEVEE